jgi:hypothetical protein
MIHRGRVKNGAIHLDDPVKLPEGATVRIEIEAEPESSEHSGSSFAERFAEVMGKARSLPEDAAENHDRYLYGAVKR